MCETLSVSGTDPFPVFVIRVCLIRSFTGEHFPLAGDAPGPPISF